MIAQISAVNMDAESGNLMEMTVSDGKTAADATQFPPRDPSIHRNVITVPTYNFY